MWAAYLGSYTALAAALTVAGEPMQLVDVFGLLFGRNAADFAALLPGGALGTAAPAARWLLLAVPTGLVCGAVGTAFHLAVEHVTEWRPRCCPRACAAR